MADQKRIKLYPLHATPKNIIVRELPVATPSAGTTIYLYETHATPKNIIIRNPLVADVPAGGGAINATADQTLENVTQAATAQVIISATASQTIAAVTQTVTADVLVQSTAAQTIDAVTQSTSGDLLVQATAAQTIEAFTQAASGDAIINATADQTIAAVTQDATAGLVPLPAQGFGGFGARNYRGNVGKLTDSEWEKARKAFAKARRKRKELEAKTNPKAVKQLASAVSRETQAYIELASIDAIKAAAFKADAAVFYANEEEEFMFILAMAA